MTKDLEEKSLAVLLALANEVAGGHEVTFSKDWGFGTATVRSSADGSHTHIGEDSRDEEGRFRSFVEGLYDLFCLNRGLGFVMEFTDAK